MEGSIAHFFKTYTLHQNYQVYSDRKFMPALTLKFTNTFVLALVEEMYTNFPKDFSEAKQNCQKCLHFNVEYFLFSRLGLSNPIEMAPYKAF